MILAIDYGAKRIGLALAEAGSKLVLPAGVIANTGSEAVLEELKKIIAEKQVELVVVGWPVNLSGEAGFKAKEVEAFIAFLQNNLSVSVEKIDERVSSRLADTLAQGTPGSRDVGAAMVLLEGYLAHRSQQV